MLKLNKPTTDPWKPLSAVLPLTRLPHLLLALLLTLILPPGSQGQTKTGKLSVIRRTYRDINSDPSLKKRTIDDAEEFLGHATDGGGELDGYFKKDSIRKIVATIGLSYGSITDAYYFKDGHLIFVYETENDFPENNRSGELDYTKLELAFEGRYYFDTGHLIDKIEKGKRRFQDRQANATSFITEAADYVRLLREKGR